MEQELSITFEQFFDAVRSYIDDEKELDEMKMTANTDKGIEDKDCVLIWSKTGK